MKSNFDNKNYILTTTEPIKLISSPIISNRNMNPLHPVGYLGSAILTKGKTGLGSLQQPLKELYSMYVQKSGCKAQQRLLIISTEGLTFQWNDSGVEKFINNSLSSVYDVQLLKIVSEKRKDKKFYCAFLPLGEETDPRYSNLFLQIDKQHQRAFESSSSETCHPSIIALIMRRSQGIQALECHVLITRSGCEANQIVNCIRSACSKYKFNVSQQTDVFQYKPYTVDNNNNNNNNNINFENHVDLITGLNTSSNAVSLMGHKEKLKKTEVNLGIKNNQSLLSKLKANLKENNFMHKNKDVVGMPPLPARKNISSNIKLPSSNEDTTTTTTNKKSILCSASARDITARVENDESKKNKSNSVRIVTEKVDNSKKQKSKISACSAVSFDEEKSGDSKKLASSSTTSINKQEKKLSLGKRLLLSARSSIKGSKLSNSSTTISKNEKSLNNYDYIHKNVSDIDFRRTSKNKTNDARLVDANMMYPFVQQPVRTISTLNVINNDIQQQQQNRFIPPKYVNPKIGQNFILKSRSSASPIIVQRQHVSQQTTNNNSPSSIGYEKKLATSYQSTPSLVVVTTENHNNNLQQKQQQQQQRFISRSPSTTSINNNNNNNNNKFQNRTTSVNSVPIGRESRRPTPIMGTNYHAQYVRNCSSHAASQSDINNIITTRTKLKSPLEDPKLMSTHLVWNKNSKSAENLDSNHIIATEIHSTSNNNNVRAVSPISSINSIYTTTTTNQNLSASRENLNQNEQNVITYKNSTKIRDSPMIQKGPLNKTVIVVRNDDYFIQPETISTTTTTTTTTQLGNKQQQQNETITTENYNSLRKSSSRLDLVEEQERCISNASMKSFTSSGIKLVPAYTYEMNEAAIQRRNRLREIEENLYKDSPVSFHQMCHQTPTERSSEYYHFNQDTEYSDNDHEVIDLTKQARLNEFTANKSVDLPIEIYFTNQQNNNNNVSSRIINMEPFENDFNHHQISRAHSNYENNQTTSNRSVHHNSTSSTQQQQQQQYFSELDNNKQINYVYYYGSNEDFGGY
jgi:hypothetical protein